MPLCLIKWVWSHNYPFRGVLCTFHIPLHVPFHSTIRFLHLTRNRQAIQYVWTQFVFTYSYHLGCMHRDCLMAICCYNTVLSWCWLILTSTNVNFPEMNYSSITPVEASDKCFTSFTSSRGYENERCSAELTYMGRALPTKQYHKKGIIIYYILFCIGILIHECLEEIFECVCC